MTDKSAAAVREFAEKWGYLPDVYKYEPEDAGVTITMGTWHRDKEGLLSNLTALIEEHYYPKKFIKWKDTRYHCVAGLYLEKQPEGSDKTFRQIPHFTLDELYQYWKENEQ